jgi:hypothetical protein
MKNTILTTAHNINMYQLKPFIFSFKKYQPDTQMVIFTNQRKDKECIEDETIKIIEFSYTSFRMRHIECLFWPVWKTAFKIFSNEAINRKIARKVFNLFFLRNLLYLEFLESLKTKPEWVFLTDCRDTIFQDNLFARLNENGLYVFGEGRKRSIGSCQINSRMLRNCFGLKALDELSGFEPLCAGTVIGDFQNIFSYLTSMVNYAMKINRMRMVPGDDQGLHNYIIRKEILRDVIFRSVEQGPIGTLGCLLESDIKESSNHLVLQNDGQPYAFLHQQDRHKKIVENHPIYRECYMA